MIYPQVQAPGTSVPHEFKTSNGKQFKIRPIRSVRDQIQIRAVAMDLCASAGLSPQQASVMVDRQGFEYQCARMIVMLVDAPPNWKRQDELTKQDFIDPMILDFDGEDSSEFQEVNQEIFNFLNRFHESKLRELAAKLSGSGSTGNMENLKSSSEPGTMGNNQ